MSILTCSPPPHLGISCTDRLQAGITADHSGILGGAKSTDSGLHGFLSACCASMEASGSLACLHILQISLLCIPWQHAGWYAQTMYEAWLKPAFRFHHCRFSVFTQSLFCRSHIVAFCCCPVKLCSYRPLKMILGSGSVHNVGKWRNVRSFLQRG